MKLTSTLKQQIDNMSYEQLLYKWRFAPAGTDLFQGETGEYFKSKLFEKRNQLSVSEQVAVSKYVGWEQLDY